MTYTVQKGDMLSRIAPRFGVTTTALYNANRAVIGRDPDKIYPGQILEIPGTGGGGGGNGGVTTVPGGVVYPAGSLSSITSQPWFMPALLIGGFLLFKDEILGKKRGKGR